MDQAMVNEALDILQQPTKLHILTLAEPLLSSNVAIDHTTGQRSSNVSSTDGNGVGATPASLRADLAHYQELFSKLRFSYVEQVTKERFLRAIVADPPQLVDARDNDELAERLVGAKAALKAKKEEVARMTEELEEMGRTLARNHEQIQLQATQLEALPEEIANLEATISELRASQETKSEDPTQSMPLNATLNLLAAREAELAELDRQLADLQSSLPRKKRDVTRLEGELKPLEARKREAVAAAQEAKRRREQGGMQDEVEEKGRWLRSVDTGLRAMLEVDA